MKKRILSMLLAIVMVMALLPTVAFAAETTYDLWVGGVQVTSANKDNIVVPGATGTATYDHDSKTLTLNNFSYTGQGYVYDYPWCAAIYTQNDLTVNLVGSNTVTASVTGDYTAEALNVGGALTITGDSGSTLTLTGTGRKGVDCGGNLKIEDVTVNATGLSSLCSWEGNITINNATVYATATGSGIYEGAIIALKKNITIENSKVTATASSGNAISIESGDLISNTCTIKNSEVTISNAKCGMRLATYANLKVENSTLTITAIEKAIDAYGANDILVDNHVVYAGDDASAGKVDASTNATYANKYVRIEPLHKHCVCGAEHEAVGSHTAEDKQTWTAINNAEELLAISSENGYYYLADNIQLTENWQPKNGTKLCLNGHDITFTSGCIDLRYTSDFTLTDCEPYGDIGEISGGTGNSNYGGGVYVRGGVFTMYGSKITGNSASNGGGVAMYNANGTTFRMYGGEISGNTCSYGDVYYGYNAYFEVAGSPVIGQVFMQNAETREPITVGATGLTEGASITVKPGAKPFTVAGEGSAAYIDYFHSYDPVNYPLVAVDSKICVANLYTVKYNLDLNNKSVTAEEKVAIGDKISKPADPEAAGYEFVGWYLDNKTFENQWNFETDRVTEDIISTDNTSRNTVMLYAKWALLPPTITAEGYSGVYNGKEHSISVTATHAANGSMGDDCTYQWYKGGKDEEHKIADATNASFSVTNVADSGVYYCKVILSDNAFTYATNKYTSEAWSDGITVSISKQEVTPPTIAEKVFTGSTLTADVPASALYTVTANNGGIAVGEYDVVLSLKDKDNYMWENGDSDDLTLKFNIVTADSQITIPADITETYGDTITLTAEVGIPAVSTFASRPGQNQVAFYCGETLLGIADVNYTNSGANGTATLEYDTSDRKLAIGENTITAYYGGSVNLNGSDSDSITVNLLQKELTVTAADQTITYGETIDTSVTMASAAELVGSDALTSVTLTANAVDVPGGQILPADAVIMNGDTDVTGYYAIRYVNGVLTINPKEASLEWSELTAAELVYSGTAKTLTATATGLVDGDACTVTVELVGDNVNVGTFSYKATALSNENYKLPTDVSSPSYTITPKTLTITAEDKETYVGSRQPDLTYTVDGLVDDDALTTAPVLTTDANMYRVGAYTITASGADAGDNYSITYVNGTLTVKNYPYIPQPTYDVEIADDITGGEVSASKKIAYRGDTITITVTPDAGYELTALTVTDSRGNTVAVTKISDSKYTFKMPGYNIEIDAVFAKIDTTCPGDKTCPMYGYTDLDMTAWYHDGVHFCIANDLMTGTASDTFAPGMTTSRAMIVTILWRLEGKPVVNYAMSFEDVAADTWYTEAIRWAQANKIVSGYSDEAFGPNDVITREQLATILYRYEQYKGGGFTGAWMIRMDYVDLADVSDWAYEAMCWMNMNSIVNGKPGKVLDPKGSATRAEAATMLYRYCEVSSKDEEN